MLLLNCGVEKTLESLLDCKEIQPVHPEGDRSLCSLEGLMLKLKLYFGYLMWRVDLFERPWCWERLKVWGEGDDRGWDGWMASPTQWTLVWVNSRSWWWTGRPGAAVHVVATSWTWLSEWTEKLHYSSHVCLLTFKCKKNRNLIPQPH